MMADPSESISGHAALLAAGLVKGPSDVWQGRRPQRQLLLHSQQRYVQAAPAEQPDHDTGRQAAGEAQQAQHHQQAPRAYSDGQAQQGSVAAEAAAGDVEPQYAGMDPKNRRKWIDAVRLQSLSVLAAAASHSPCAGQAEWR